MSKFLERLEQINRGSSAAPLGFGATRPQKTPAMALVGLVTGDYPSGISKITDLALDAALVARSDGTPSIAELTKPLGSKLPWGVRVPSLTEEEAQTYQDSGCDLLVFFLEGTPVSAVASEDMARVLCVAPGLEDREQRAINALPVDVLLVPMADRPGPWTLAELATVGAISRGARDTYILVEVSQPPDKKELEALRNLGVHGLVLDVGAVRPEAMDELKASLLELPRQRPSRSGRGDAVLPSSVFMPAAAPGREDEEEEDDDGV